MNEICKDCGGPIHWVETEHRWYHDRLADILACPSVSIKQATA